MLLSMHCCCKGLLPRGVATPPMLRQATPRGSGPPPLLVRMLLHAGGLRAGNKAGRCTGIVQHGLQLDMPNACAARGLFGAVHAAAVEAVASGPLCSGCCGRSSLHHRSAFHRGKAGSRAWLHPHVTGCFECWRSVGANALKGPCVIACRFRDPTRGV